MIATQKVVTFFWHLKLMDLFFTNDIKSAKHTDAWADWTYFVILSYEFIIVRIYRIYANPFSVKMFTL